MKVFIAGCFLIGVLQVKSAPLSSEQKETLQTYHKECLRESNVNEILVEKSRKGIYSEDPTFKSYLYCFSQKLGLQDATGAIQKDVFKKKVTGLVEDPTVLARLVEQCTRPMGSPKDTAFSIATCIREVAPTLEVFKAPQKIIYLSNEKTQKILLDHKDCAAKDVLDDEVIEQARKQGILFEDPKFKSYIYCFTRKQGFQREDGSVDKDVFYKRLGEVIQDSAALEKLAEHCVQQQKTPEETAFFLSKCINENSPVYVEIFPREIPVPNEEAKKIIEHGRTCIKQTGVDREVVENTRKGIYAEEDPKLKEFTFCMAKLAGFLNKAGDIQVDVVREKTLKLVNDPAVVEKLIDMCAVKKDTPVETAFHSHVCFHKNSPGHLSITQFGAVSEAQKEKRSQIIKECAENTGVSRGVVLSARKGDFQDDPLLKDYFFCINKKSGILDESGEYRNDFMRKSLTEIFNAEEADRIIGKCAKIQDNALNTSFQGLKCFFHEAPEITVIF